MRLGVDRRPPVECNVGALVARHPFQLGALDHQGWVNETEPRPTNTAATVRPASGVVRYS